MFDVGFWELVVLFGLGLMILGPERMPKVASQVGRWAGQARRMARNLTSQIQNEIEPLQSTMKSMDETLHKDFSKMRPDISRKADEGSAPGARPDISQETDGESTPEIRPDISQEAEGSAVEAGEVADEEGGANKVDDDSIASRNEAP
jgi:sec-independent protein translocase protein TatB